MRRIMLLVLLALALPTAALANSVDFNTGTFSHGSISRQSNGGLSHPDNTITVVGSSDTIIVSTSVLTSGCSVATTGACTFASGTIEVKDPMGTIVFSDSLINGVMTKTPGGATMSATFLPNAMTSTSGLVAMTVNFNSTGPISGDLTSGTAIAVSFAVPEPSALEGLLLGTGILGFSEMGRRKLKLGT